ncbi:alpha/beta fold hydrolase [Streptomyces filamentosus]|uniref:Alpha/beta hydrolase n=1 Tax=Streptomyces filamentosus TaxID=67294 RepID=A0A919BXW8_STRFL|nr:alpha/beta fold hydrolase [Streptomyces filamentosus]GHG23965.1 alpha/beta hydrolase [Streptomyces filamentosus]
MSGSERSAALPALHLPEPRFLPAVGAVLLLHGGRADSLAPPSALNLPDLRMRAFARALGQDPRHADVLIGYVRYRMRGWNGERADPVHDTRRALAELADLAGPLPVVLLGHSMGARAALRAADDPHVRGVVALAPWCPPGEPVTHLANRSVIALHDPADPVTSATDTWTYLRRAEAAGARVRGIRMPGGRHTMIGRSRLWHSLAARSTVEVLGRDSPPSTSAPETMWGAGPLDAVMFIPSVGERHPIRPRRRN